MRVLIPVFFNAPMGGLQAHVRAQVDALDSAGAEAVVMCRPGPFADSLEASGHTVLRTTFDPIRKAVREALAAGPFDLVHAHPYRSRAVGVDVARSLEIPLILTHHGPYLDELPVHAGDVDMLLAVSGAARDKLAQESGVPPERVHVFHNGVDLERFAPRDVTDEALLAAHPALDAALLGGGRRRVLLPTRLDVDKQFIVDAVVETLRKFASQRPQNVPVWLVAGDGKLRAELEHAAEELEAACGQPSVAFLGWQDEAGLADLYSAADLAVAPGRCAIEAMACGTPVVAIGSRGYVGLMNGDLALRGAYENFGGYGAKHEDYRPGAMYDDVTRALGSDTELERLGRLGRELAATMFDQARIDRHMLDLYRLCLAVEPRTAIDSVELPALPFSFDGLAAPWSLSTGQVDRHVDDDGTLSISYDLGDRHAYLVSGRTDFSEPPREDACWKVAAGRCYQLDTDLDVPSDDTARLFLIEYSDETRLGDVSTRARSGLNRVSLVTSEGATRLRVAIRFSGVGEARIAPLTVSEVASDNGR